MNILRSVSQSVLGGQQEVSQPSGADIVEKLLDRVQSATLPEDRRDACKALKTLSKKYRVLVGAHGMDSLIQVLESDRNDHEIVSYALDTLINITATENFEEEEIGENSLENVDNKLGEQFTEIFIKRPENISLVLGMLDEFDFRVCYPSMKLLANLLSNRPKEMQDAILITPNGVSKLIDLLLDSREVIRNDAIIILTQLAKGNNNTQKIIVFENAYDHIFKIIKQEENSEGGIVVEDCLILLLSLLKNNASNQTLFKEGNYMQRITEFVVQPSTSDYKWSTQSSSNVRLMLKVIRTLVSPKNPAQLIGECQKKMNYCNLLRKLCSLLMAVGVPADILADTISTVADTIRGNQENQEFFSTVTAPSNPPRPAIVVLLMSMVNEKQPFMLRSAVLYCFQCFLFHNASTQSQIVQTLLPQSADAITNQITPGQMLCGGLFSSDSVSNWFSAIALSHVLMDNVSLKEQLLRVQLSSGVGVPSVSLLQQCMNILEGNPKMLTRLGLLQFLCMWVTDCPLAVSKLLNISSFVPYLSSSITGIEHDEMEIIYQGVCAFLLGLCGHFYPTNGASISREALKNIVCNRIGVECFTDKLENILRTEANTRAAKSTQLHASSSSEIVFDHEFTRLYKIYEASALKAVTPKGSSTKEDEFIAELETAKETIKNLSIEVQTLHKAVETANNELVAAQANAANQKTATDDNLVEKYAELEKNMQEMTYARDYYYYQMIEKENLLQSQKEKNEKEVLDQKAFEVLKREHEALKTEQEDSLILLSEQEAKLCKYKECLQKYGHEFSDSDDADELL